LALEPKNQQGSKERKGLNGESNCDFGIVLMIRYVIPRIPNFSGRKENLKRTREVPKVPEMVKLNFPLIISLFFFFLQQNKTIIMISQKGF
jgi:hypothetical protein